LTNWVSVAGFLERAKQNPSIVSYSNNPKNARRFQSLYGLLDFQKRPDVLVFLHCEGLSVAVSESVQASVPSVGIVDTDTCSSGLT